MRKPLLALALAASLCLNAGVGAAWLLGHLRHHRPPDLAAQLGLGSPQKAQFEANFAALKRHLGPLDQELETERARLLDLVASANPSPEALRAQQEAVLTVQNRIQDTVTAHLLKQKQLLTPDQQKRFFDHLRRRMESSGRLPPVKDMEKPK